MSCCGGNCGCGSGCKCGNGCGGCKMYPDMEGTSSTESLIFGVSAMKTHFEEAAEMGSAEHDCKCGANCTCDPCKCGK